MCVILHFFVGNLFHFWFTDLDSESMKKSNRFFFFCFFGDFFPIFFCISDVHVFQRSDFYKHACLTLIQVGFRWLLLPLVILGLVTFVSSEILRSETGCRSIQVDTGVLTMDTFNSFVLTLDVDLDITEEMTNSYERTDDLLGAECATTIQNRFNQSLSDFRVKMDGVKLEKDLLSVYLSDESFLGRAKRDVGAVIFAIVVSLANAIATSLNIVLTQSNYRDLNARFELLSESIAQLRSNQNDIKGNINFLHAESQFLGIEKDVITDHLEILRAIHACDLLKLDMSARVTQFETHLSSILDVVYDKKLSNRLIERSTLENICSTTLFDRTIYRITPSLLYQLARVDFLAFDNNRLTFLISYPVIGIEYDYNLVSILNTPRSIVTSTSFEMQDSFLLPVNIELHNISENLSQIRSTQGCIKLEKLVACTTNILENNRCLEPILQDSLSDQCMVTEKKKKLFSVSYDFNRENVLINLQVGASVFRGKQMIHTVTNKSERACIYLPREKNLIIKTNDIAIKLFPNSRMHSFKRKRPSHAQLLYVSKMKLPVNNNSLFFVPMSDNEKVSIDYFDFLTLSIASVALLIIFVFMILFMAYCYFHSIDGANMFNNE